MFVIDWYHLVQYNLLASNKLITSMVFEIILQLLKINFPKNIYRFFRIMFVYWNIFPWFNHRKFERANQLINLKILRKVYIMVSLRMLQVLRWHLKLQKSQQTSNISKCILQYCVVMIIIYKHKKELINVNTFIFLS